MRPPTRELPARPTRKNDVEESCVLVGTDFSAGSAAALQEARRLATRLGCGVRVVHVVESDRARDWAPSTEAHGWLASSGMAETELDVRFGRAWVELARFADTLAPALVVVGSHGASGYQSVAMGTTAQRLCLNARHPVVLIGPKRHVPRRWTASASS